MTRSPADPLADDEQSTLGPVRFDPTQSSGRFTIAVVEGPDAGQTWVLDSSRPSRSLVGTSPVCELRLSDPKVSRRHLALEVEGERLRITDLGSKNETVIAGTTLLDGYLGGGERVRLGDTFLLVERRRSRSVRLPAKAGFGRVIGASSEMRRLYPLCERLAAADLPLLIEGEAGTGKESLAYSLHEASPRAAGPYVVLDCSTVGAGSLESELFGHEGDGAARATGSRVGLFEQADRGTLFIDDIADLSIALQAKLLGAIDSGVSQRVGSAEGRRANVRVVAATCLDLDAEAQAGRFRDDLYHRLAVGRIELPPLRRRRGDVWVLSRHFASELGRSPDDLGSEILHRWDQEPWPGNVRQLKTAVARRLLLGELEEPAAAGDFDAPGDDEPRDLVERILSKELPLPEAREELSREFTRRYLRRALELTSGNVTQAARASGVSRRYMQALKSKLGG